MRERGDEREPSSATLALQSLRLALHPPKPLMVSLSNHKPHSCTINLKKSCQLIQHHPTSLILMVSFPAGMLRKTFEVRKGSVISAAGMTILQMEWLYLTRVKPVIEAGDPRVFLVETGKFRGNALTTLPIPRHPRSPFGSPVFPTFQ
ncbi:hypothetical protein SAMN05443582_103556 [Phyllobacterium sp. OV277]|nr:hypothetical protein SAMN05443582_103556 [Phyllobacterium sp. OV277]